MDILCSCKENYIGELKYNMGTRRGDHEILTHNSETAKHLH